MKVSPSIDSRNPHAVLDRLHHQVGGVQRISKRKVPYLYVGGDDCLSACYFKTKDVLRVFTQSGKIGAQQKRYDFKDLEEAGRFILDKLGTNQPQLPEAFEVRPWDKTPPEEIVQRPGLLFEPTLLPLRCSGSFRFYLARSESNGEPSRTTAAAMLKR
jgi:hypothetical protein